MNTGGDFDTAWVSLGIGWMLGLLIVMLGGLAVVRALRRRSDSPLVRQLAPTAVTLTIIAIVLALGMLLALFLIPGRAGELDMATNIAGIVIGLAVLLIGAMIIAAGARWVSRQKR